jgi:hypothetical protein
MTGLVPGRLGSRSEPAVLAVLLLALGAGPAAGHHVGAYVPRDNEVSANFKQIKFSLQARKFDVASRLFEEGAVRAEMQARAARLPAGLEEATRAALRAGEAAGAERGLMIFFAALTRDLALEADGRLADASEPMPARAAAGRKFLEAIWRYYNLIDFAVSQYDGKAAVAIRLAFDEAENYAKGPASASGWWLWSWWWASAEKSPAGRPGAAPDLQKVREALRRIAQTLSALVEMAATSTRRDP